jgi:hypothetical protein
VSRADRLRFPRCLTFLAASALFLQADPAPPAAPPGYKNVAIKQGGGVGYIQVKDTQDPYRNVKDSSGDKEPDHFSFGMTSDMSNKTYSSTSDSTLDTTTYQKNVQKTFVTQSYFANDAEASDKATPNIHSAYPVSSADGFSNTAPGYNKSFLTASADVDQNKSFATAAASESGRTADLGGHEIKTYASPMSSKTYQGREADAIKRDLDDMNQGLVGLKDLPNRPLTIDEVRALINHGIKPDTDEKPPEPDKPLNDPDYTPDDAPAPYRAQPGHLRDDAPDNDIIPPPGMMGPTPVPAPENSAPLPK